MSEKIMRLYPVKNTHHSLQQT